jgi:Family of unknown function (DUF5681)
MENKEQVVAVKAKGKAGKARWAPGQSGNPRGTRTGSKHKATLFAESLLSGEAEGLVRKVVELAKAGDVGALKICMDRLLPPLKSRPVNFKLPTLRTTSDALAALTALVEGMSSGQLLAEEVEPLAATILAFIKAVETAQLEDRLAALEKAAAEDASGEASRGHRYDA